MTKMRVGVIGTGRIAAGSHLPCLAKFPDVELILCDVDGARLQTIADKFSIRETRSDYRQMLAQDKLDAVFVLTPSTATYGVSKDCLAAGVNTLMEKPPGMSTAETRDLQAAAQATGAKSMVGVNRRFQPMLNQARQMVEANGKIAMIIAEFYHFSIPLYRSVGSPENTLANIVVSAAIHTVDLIRYLGGNVTEVYAHAHNYFDQHPDSFTAMLRFDSGATGLFNYNLTSPVRIEKVCFHGRQASAFLVGLAESCVVHQDEMTYDLKNIKRIDPSSPEWSDRPYNPYINGWWHQARFFLDCVKEHRQPAFPASNLEDAVKTMELIDMIRHQIKGLVAAH